SFLVEQFLAERWGEHPRVPTMVSADEPEARARDGMAPRPSLALRARQESDAAVGSGHLGAILIHAHCHQRALWGASSTADLLERLFPGRVRVLDTTCCGLAGSFGYARERFDLSMRIGELGVLPAARDMRPGDVLVAPGTSCRHQIRDGAGVRAVHAVELVADAIKQVSS
ncbi:MAG: hypothetical protein K8E66_05775, partial [Phycisphaerales bacterium]|nr:hypothetical protein [Phycisphaerales bacterium]